MRAGKLDRQITIQNRTNSVGALGGVSQSWADLATVWARVEPVLSKGREYMAAGQMITGTETLFTIRHIDGVSTKSRISYEGQYYDIVSVVEMGRQQGFQIVGKLP